MRQRGREGSLSMTDQTIPETKSSEALPLPVERTASAKSGGKGLSIFAILLSLAALGGSGYNVYKSQLSGVEQQNNYVVKINEIGTNVTVLAERMAQLQRAQRVVEQSSVSSEQLQTRLLETNSKNDLVFRDIKATQKDLQNTLEKLSVDSQRSGDKLALEEVSQLLKLANNSAVFAGDKRSAISALKLADSQLKQLADPRYAVVRRSINEEISILNEIASVDVITVTSKLDEIAKKISTLPLENEPPVIGELDIAHHTNDEQMTFTSELKKLWVDTLNTVKIKRIDQPPKPLLAPEQRYFLDQNIQLKLNTAELAVMQGNGDVYRRNIEAATAWINEYFDPLDENVRQVASELSELAGENLGGKLPSIAASYDELQRIKGGN
ncbi:uroporphyrinogen-III C-methyltransferase [Arenicella sp. 4NH20-0111]